MAIDPVELARRDITTSNHLPQAAGSAQAEDIEDMSADMDNMRMGHDWTGEEYQKHVQAMRDRYPMLTGTFLRAPARDNANLSTIDNTNKYARLADAYNAQMRYVDGGLKAGFGTWEAGAPRYEAVNKLETQDQKQMDQLRQAQGDLRQHQLGQESFFQQDVWKRKADEMQKLVEEGYKRQFWQKTEQRRRLAAQFDSWRAMNEQQFMQTMTKIGIPSLIASNAHKLLQSGDYLAYAQLLNAQGLTPMAIDQIYSYTATADTIKQLANDEIDAKTAAEQLQKVPTQYVIAGLESFLKVAASYPEGSAVQKTGAAAQSLLDKAAGLAGGAANNLELVLGGMAGAGILKALLPLFVAKAGAGS
jgi:hypothetical protein